MAWGAEQNCDKFGQMGAGSAETPCWSRPTLFWKLCRAKARRERRRKRPRPCCSLPSFPFGADLQEIPTELGNRLHQVGV